MASPAGITEPPPPGGEAIVEPPPPPLKGFDRRAHSLVGFHLGFPGSATLSNAEGDLATTYGFNLRSDIPVARYLLLGPLLQFGAWLPEIAGQDQNHHYYVDVDFYLRGRVPFDTPGVDFQLWAGIPIGLTVNILSGDVDPAVSGVGFGWNVGALAGGAAHFSKEFGLFSEFGYLQHKGRHSVEGADSIDFTLLQWVFNVGFVFKS
jgi:hypothetical protein